MRNVKPGWLQAGEATGESANRLVNWLKPLSGTASSTRGGVASGLRGYFCYLSLISKSYQTLDPKSGVEKVWCKCS